MSKLTICIVFPHISCYLHKCTHNSEACQSEVFKWSRLADSVQKRVEEQGNVGWEEGREGGRGRWDGRGREGGREREKGMNRGGKEESGYEEEGERKGRGKKATM